MNSPSPFPSSRTHPRCPKALSFVCDLSSLIGDAIEEGIKAATGFNIKVRQDTSVAAMLLCCCLTDPLLGTPRQDWFNHILEEIGHLALLDKTGECGFPAQPALARGH